MFGGFFFFWAFPWDGRALRSKSSPKGCGLYSAIPNAILGVRFVILFGGGKVALIWNSRVEDSPVVREEGNIHRLYCPCFYGFSGGLEKLTDSIGAFFNHRFQVVRFPNDLSYTREQYLRRMMSTSYALTEGGEERSSWLGALEKLFDRFETEGRVTVPNETVVYLGKC